MAQVFHRSTNTISKLSIVGGMLIAGAFTGAWYFVDRSSFVTLENQPMSQPVPFSHRHHYSGLGIDCRYCHASVETSNYAGMPATETCMSCHSQIWRENPLLEPVRASYATGVGLRWNRVYDLPNYVYFDHSIHVKKGVGCSECHGRVDQMPLTWKNSALFMEWCLNCHRDPAQHIRLKSEVFNMNWKAGDDQAASSAKLLKENPIQKKELLTSCSTCHR